MFDAATRGQSLMAEWRETDAGFGTAEAQILLHGRAADLVVIGQRDNDWAYAGQLEAPDSLAINLGRPLLLVPNVGAIAAPPKRAVIAWNGRREAARAAFDALALLPRGADVTILWADTSADPAVGGDASGADLATALARHGLSCETTRVRAPDGDAARCILSEAAGRGADLIVMGAYGHSRLREFVLGGASRDMLAGMDRLVLMSH
jgi:nucleotide-binding universal stress UspA family protein